MPTEHDGIAPPNSSPEIGELAAALAAAQAEFVTVAKDNTAKVETSKGPGYTYKYADLASCLEAVRGPLSKHGLAVMQTTVPGGQDIMLRTILAHSSGQWIASDFPLIVGEWTKPQAVGSVITYARRYTLCAMLQIATDDDDGAAAQQHTEQRRPASQPRPAKPMIAYRKWLEGYCKAVNEKWSAYLVANGEKPADLVTIFQVNRHLLKALDIPIRKGAKEPEVLKAGDLAWEGNADAMEAEATAYCRHQWKEAVTALKAKAKPREPGSDDNMPSPDEEALLDRQAGREVIEI